jgi:ABC-type multidrug transport system ATPase subunit
MIFDDSLSAVDTETDAKIRAALEKRFGSATIILISHRITTLSRADKVLVLDHGSVAQFGTPAELSAQPGLYKQIEEIQSFHGEDPSGDPIYGEKQIPRQIAADGEEAQNRNSCDDCRESEVSE